MHRLLVSSQVLACALQGIPFLAPGCVCARLCVCLCVCWNGGCRIKNNLLGINLHLPGFFCPDGQRNSLRDEQRKISFLHARKHTGLFAWKFLGRPTFVSVSCVSLTLFMNFHILDSPERA